MSFRNCRYSAEFQRQQGMDDTDLPGTVHSSGYTSRFNVYLEFKNMRTKLDSCTSKYFAECATGNSSSPQPTSVLTLQQQTLLHHSSVSTWMKCTTRPTHGIMCFASPEILVGTDHCFHFHTSTDPTCLQNQ